MIYSDAPELRQVALNLLSNAAQAIGKDGAITIITRPAGRERRGTGHRRYRLRHFGRESGENL